MSDLPPTSSSLPPGPRPRRLWQHILMASVIFLGGVACGAAVTCVVITRLVHHAIQHPEEATAHFTAHLTRRLNLTDEQSEQVRQIIERRQRALTEIRRDIQPRLHVELSALEEEINSVLNDAQRVEWRALAGKFRDRWLPPVPASQLDK
jgi:hypothetical protein